MANNRFTPGATSSLGVTVVSANVALTGIGDTLDITNAGASLVFVKLGTSTVTASVAIDYPILPSQSKKITRGPGDTHIAAISSGTAAIYITVGAGE